MLIRLLMVAGLLAGLSRPLIAQQVHVRDSLSVHIVENPSRAASPIAFRLAPTVNLTLGGLSDDPSREFDQRNGYLQAAQLSDGRLVVIDRDQLHWIGSDGKRLLSVGRTGGGPGEFRYITTICVTRADTVVVWDDANRRLGILSSTGQFVRHISVATGSPPGQGCFGDGQVLVVDLTLASDDPVGPMLTGRVIDLRGNDLSRGLQFVPGSMDAVNRVATQIAVGDRLIVADGLGSEYREYAADGKLGAIVRTRDEANQVTAADYDRLLDRMVPAQPKAKEIKARLNAQRTSTHWPAFGKLLADPLGCVWMQDFNIPEQSPPAESWVGFSTEGRMLGRLLLSPPRGISRRELLSVENNVAQVRDRDSDGVAYLRFILIDALRPDTRCAG